MTRITVRKPGWALRKQIHCTVNGQACEPRWSGARMVFEGLKGDETLVIETPVASETSTYTLVNLADPQNSNEQYACEFKGYTAIRVERTVPGLDAADHNWYRIFRREAMRAAQAPMKPAPAYVHPAKLLNWLMIV